MNDKLLFVREVADRLGRSEAALRWMMQQGTAPKYAKLGGRVVFRESDVDAFVASAFDEAAV
ncbi:helix-turn-helix transcriptional regulator [Microbacterium sp. 179-I 3D2 NHS]|uniref:helix-turn-helix transcriptional regulator n=1 Tax=Microbacterium sp. 179-I 3D2 NHS TaxID=3235178 RepID=UPI0039A104ED